MTEIIQEVNWYLQPWFTAMESDSVCAVVYQVRSLAQMTQVC